MIVETFAVGSLRCNCTILGDEVRREAIVIDPGDDAPLILESLRRLGLTLKQMVCTHTHIDHVGAIFELQHETGAPASIHAADLFLYEKLAIQAQWLGVPPPRPAVVDCTLTDGTPVGCGDVEINTIHTPGHTPGSTTFQLSGNGNMLFTGDTLFMNSVGRTDLWGGSQADLLRSIRNRLMTFDDETQIIPGHGPSTTIGRERRHNPFLR